MAIAFNDTTNKNGIIQRCEILTGLGDGTISGSTTLLKQFTALINSACQKVESMILASQDDWDFDDTGTTDGSTATYSNLPTTTTALSSSTRNTKFPASLKILKIKRVDVTYDNTTWYRAEAFDSQESGLGFGNDSLTDARFSKTAPKYDIKADVVAIYPMASAADVSAGASIRIEYTREMSEFVYGDTTKTLGFDAPFQPLVPILASNEWNMANAPALVPNLLIMAQDYEGRMKQYYGRKNESRTVVLKSAYISYE